MITVSEEQLDRLRSIKNAFPDIPEIPEPEAWRQASADQVWIRLISQVVVVGNAAPAKRLWEGNIPQRLAWEKISTLSEADARTEIWQVLREIQTRYAGKSLETCNKTAAIMRNREWLMAFQGGPKGFLSTVAEMPGGDKAKIEFVSKNLSYIGNKGARDFLTTGFGIVRDSITIDSRIRNSMLHVGIEIPEDQLGDPAVYSEIESDLLKQVCKPLGLLGSELDQLLFIKYKEIIKRAW